MERLARIGYPWEGPRKGRVSKGTGEQGRKVRVGSSEKSGEREGTREERRLRIRLTCHHCLPPPAPPPPQDPHFTGKEL